MQATTRSRNPLRNLTDLSEMVWRKTRMCDKSVFDQSNSILIGLICERKKIVSNCIIVKLYNITLSK